jgi:hypothetical protein
MSGFFDLKVAYLSRCDGSQAHERSRKNRDMFCNKRLALPEQRVGERRTWPASYGSQSLAVVVIAAVYCRNRCVIYQADMTALDELVMTCPSMQLRSAVFRDCSHLECEHLFKTTSHSRSRQVFRYLVSFNT